MSRLSIFVERFFLPLVRGGPLHVGAPLGPRGLRRLLEQDAGDVERPAAGRGTSPAEELAEARGRVARVLQPAPRRFDLDEPSLRLAVAVHDLLFLFHPAAGATARDLSGRDERLREVSAGARELATLPQTSDAHALVARHTVLHLLPMLSRVDAKVRFWAGTREFRGRVPPKRLTAWPSLRRVTEERWRVDCFVEAASDPLGGSEALRALLQASPLTDLLHPLRAEPPLDLAGVHLALADPRLCRLVAYEQLRLGLEHTGGPIATATLALLDHHDAAACRFALSFVSHLHLCAVASAESADPQAEVLRLSSGPDAQRDFCALYPATLRVAPELALPGELQEAAAGSPPLRARLLDHAEACRVLCGGARVDELGSFIARSIGTAALATRDA